MSAAVLYLSYDGILEPLGQAQVLRYLERLAADRRMVLMSFEKPDDWMEREQREAMRRHMQATGIDWIPLRYHKRPRSLATAYDIAFGTLVGAWAVLRHSVGIVHARSYVASVIALALKQLFGVKYVFDMRGFWAEERVDGGLWPPEGRLYRAAKWFEQRFLLNADCVVSLTRAAVEEVRTFPYLQGRMPRFEVITTCADLDLFRPADPVSLSADTGSPFTLGYVGSVGVWYLFDDVLRCFQLLRLRVPGARLHILNRGGHAHIRERLAVFGIDEGSVHLETADHAGVARAMQRMDAGAFFIKPVYSKIASAPTRLGEFLGSGIPCLSNAGVGDMAEILEGEDVGVAVRGFDDAELREAVERLLELTRNLGIRDRCRRAAVRHFSLEQGVAEYARIYRELTPL